jgi:hypothetical protein
MQIVNTLQVLAKCFSLTTNAGNYSNTIYSRHKEAMNLCSIQSTQNLKPHSWSEQSLFTLLEDSTESRVREKLLV